MWAQGLPWWAAPCIRVVQVGGWVLRLHVWCCPLTWPRQAHLTAAAALQQPQQLCLAHYAHQLSKSRQATGKRQFVSMLHLLMCWRAVLVLMLMANIKRASLLLQDHMVRAAAAVARPHGQSCARWGEVPSPVNAPAPAGPEQL